MRRYVSGPGSEVGGRHGGLTISERMDALFKCV